MTKEHKAVMKQEVADFFYWKLISTWNKTY